MSSLTQVLFMTLQERKCVKACFGTSSGSVFVNLITPTCKLDLEEPFCLPELFMSNPKSAS